MASFWLVLGAVLASFGVGVFLASFGEFSRILDEFLLRSWLVFVKFLASFDQYLTIFGELLASFSKFLPVFDEL